MHPHTITTIIGIVLLAVFKPHLAINAAGFTITVSVPCAVLATIGVTVAVLAALTIRELASCRLRRQA